MAIDRELMFRLIPEARAFEWVEDLSHAAGLPTSGALLKPSPMRNFVGLRSLNTRDVSCCQIGSTRTTFKAGWPRRAVIEEHSKALLIIPISWIYLFAMTQSRHENRLCGWGVC